MILTTIKKYITLEEFKELDFGHSKIINCIIKNKDNEIISISKKYNTIITDIYKSLSTSFIIQNTTLNIKLSNENNKNGYCYNKDLNISIQQKDSNGSIKEILNMI